MKRLVRICFVGLLLYFFPASVKAQSSAGFTVSATIVNPVGISSASSYAYTDVAAKTTINNKQGSISKYEIAVADFSIDAFAEDVYSITIPGEMALRNKSGSSCITAVVQAGSLVAGQLLPNGQKRFNVNSEMVLNDDHAEGKHSSAPYEVTVNFN